MSADVEGSAMFTIVASITAGSGFKSLAAHPCCCITAEGGTVTKVAGR